MSTKTVLENVNGLYFITFTNYQWLHLFSRLKMHDEIYKWFRLLEVKGEEITGYVIMPNHLHMLLYHKHGNGGIDKLIANAKRFMTYEMINRLKDAGDTETLYKLSQKLTARDIKKGQKHKGFEDSFDCKRCYTEKFILQKLNYMHQNPVQPKWKLCESSSDYEHSSAAFYAGSNRSYSFHLKHYQDVLWNAEDVLLAGAQLSGVSATRKAKLREDPAGTEN